MKGSQELIAHFNKREAELGEKASKFNMFLEGYAAGYNDTKAYMINKACNALNAAYFPSEELRENAKQIIRKLIEK